MKKKEIGFKGIDWVIVFLLGIGFVKKPFGLDLNLNYIAYSIFFMNLIEFKIHKKITSFIMMLFISFLAVLLFGSNIPQVYIRTAFILVLWLSITPMAKFVTEEHMMKAIVWVTILIFVDAFTAQITGNIDESTRTYFSITFPRLMGIEGNYNYTAFPYLGIALIFFFGKRYIYFLLLVVLTFFSGTRGAFLSLIIALVVYFLEKKKFRKSVNIVYGTIIYSCVFFPFIWRVILENISIETKQFVHYISTFRTVIWDAYFYVIDKNPMGIGYHNGRLWGQEQTNITQYYENGFYWLSAFNPHSVYMQVLVEFGYVGYALFSFFIVSFGRFVLKERRELLPFYIFILVSWMTVLGLFTWVFILFFVIIVSGMFMSKTETLTRK